MKILPYTKVVIESSLSSDQVISILSENCQERKAFGFDFRQGKKLEGGFLGSNFDFNRSLRNQSGKLSYRNSFIAVAEGSVIGSKNGSIIKAVLMPPFVSICFICLWLFIAIYKAISAFASTNDFSSFGFLLIGGGFAYILAMVSFWYEVPLLEKTMLEFTQGKLVPRK